MRNGNGHAISLAEAAALRLEYGAGAVEPDEVQPSLSIISPVDWEGRPVPPRRWIIPDMIPAETVTLFSANGGDGKSLLMLQLAYARALGKKWLDVETEPGSTLYLSAEDDRDELHRRSDGIRRHFGAEWSDFVHVHLVDLVGVDAVLGDIDPRVRTRIVATPLYAKVAAEVARLRPGLMICDALADVYAGNEIERSHVRQFISLMRKLCRQYQCAVILIAHPSVQGINSGSGISGSTAWNNSVRSRLYLTKPDGGKDTPLRTLATVKSNYGPAGGSMTLRYEAGAFVVVAGSIEEDQLAREEKADRVFLQLLRLHIDTDQHVGPNPSASYAPKRFADHPKAHGVSKNDFKDAMQRLLEARTIAVETIGPPSRQIKRLVEVLN